MPSELNTNGTALHIQNNNSDLLFVYLAGASYILLPIATTAFMMIFKNPSDTLDTEEEKNSTPEISHSMAILILLGLLALFITALMKIKHLLLDINLNSEAPKAIGLTPNELTHLTDALVSPEALNTAASWHRASSTIEQAECPILLDIPKIQDVIIFEKQYFDDVREQWQPLKNTTQIFSRDKLHTWLTKNNTHPLTRDAIREPSPYPDGTKTYPTTRWRILPLNPNHQDLVNRLEGYKKKSSRFFSNPLEKQKIDLSDTNHMVNR